MNILFSVTFPAKCMYYTQGYTYVDPCMHTQRDVPTQRDRYTQKETDRQIPPRQPLITAAVPFVIKCSISGIYMITSAHSQAT